MKVKSIKGKSTEEIQGAIAESKLGSIKRKITKP